jgi:hypothetical protein
MAESRIFRDLNKLVFQGSFGLQELHRPLAAIHHAVQQGGYQDLILDFSDCNAAFPAPMLALCAQITKLRKAGIDANLILPNDGKLQRLFHNTNWAHFLAPRSHDPSSFKGYTQIPATQYLSSKDQSKAVNRIVNAILGAIPEIGRADFAALEWAINELTDNVLVHSQSPVGGFVQVSTFHKKDGLHLKNERIPYDGTLVVAEIDFSVPHLLEEALHFGGRKHTPTDFLELNYEDEIAERVNFKIADEAASFGSRVAGTPIRNKLINIARMCPSQRIVIDFTSVALISSSFADEVVGKLFVELGPMMFMGRFQVVGTSHTVQALIDRAISQRVAVGNTN